MLNCEQNERRPFTYLSRQTHHVSLLLALAPNIYCVIYPFWGAAPDPVRTPWMRALPLYPSCLGRDREPS